ncbi:MAG: ligand-binding sensor domain-containing protein, partial [Planctomycetaceae bacterium]
ALLAVVPAAAAQVLNFRNYTAVDGLPQAQVLAIHQDRAGYLWFGTYGGLSRYNGDVFHTYMKEDGLGANTITAIVEDARGWLIVGTTGGGVCIMRPNDDGRCYRTADGLPDDDVRDVLPWPDGSIWIATQGGLARLANGVLHGYGAEDGLPSDDINRLARDRVGRLWVATQRGLVLWQNGRFVADTLSGLPAEPVQVVLSTPYGQLAGTATGLFLRRGERFEQMSPPGGEGIFVADAAVDSAGDVWIATHTGVLRFDGARFERLTRVNGLGFNHVNRVMVDREGDVWFGTDAGASKLVPGPFRLLTQSEGLPNPFVRAITEDAGGRVWVGTRDGVAVLEGDRFRPVDLGPLEDSRVYSVAPAPEGGMLVGTRRGLVHYQGGRSSTFDGSHRLPGDLIFSLLPDSAGVWIGTDHGLARWENGQVETVRHPTLPEDFVAIAMAFDDQGRVWMGQRSGGLLIWDGATAQTIGPAQGMTDQTVWSIARDADGVMWVGTSGDGVYRIEGDSLRRFTQRDGLINDFVWQVLPDSRGGVWLYTSRGLDRYVGGSFVHYGRGDGLVDLEGSANAALEAANGDLWFGNGSGVMHYSPALESPNTFEPPIYIEQITSDGQSIDKQAAEVSFGDGVLQIRFASPSFRDETAVRYRYRLIGAGTAWSEPTSETTIGYAGLAPRDYRFEVVALNDRGVPS